MTTPRITCPDCRTSMLYTAAACPGCKRRMVSVERTAKSGRSTSLDVYAGTPFSECRAHDCVFNVTRQDAFCPNCGLESPFRPHDSVELATALRGSWAGCCVIISMILLTVVINLIAVKVVGKTEYVWLLVTIATAISVVIPLLVHHYLRRIAGLVVKEEPEIESTSVPLTLKGSENIIQRRMNDLKTRAEQITAVMERAKHNTGEQWERVRETLDGALDTVRNQGVRYNLKLTEIKLVRWQNRVAPLLYGWEGLTFEQNEARLKALEDTRAAGSELHSKVLEFRKALGEVPDVGELLARLKETLASYKKVHEGLVARQAVLALQGVSPTKDALSPASFPTAGKRDIEIFNAQVAITDFSSSFAELEAEYARLQSESDVSQEIGRILRKIEPD